MMWDLYDSKFNKTGNIISEKNVDNIQDGLYHLTVNVWIFNSKKQILLLKKAMNYDLIYPGYWTGLNGNVLSGMNAIETVYKTVYEKIGIDTKQDKFIELGKDLRNPYHYIYNTFALFKNVELNSISLNEKYFSKAKWVDSVELENMISNGEIEYSLISRIEQYVMPILKSKN